MPETNKLSHIMSIWYRLPGRVGEELHRLLSPRNARNQNQSMGNGLNGRLGKMQEHRVHGSDTAIVPNQEMEVGILW